MSGAGAPTTTPVHSGHLKVAVVAGTWHTQVTDGLLAGALRALDDYGVVDRVVLRVPGAFELPVVVQEAALAGHDAVVALGVVIRGGTPHFEYVCSAATDGLTRVALDHRVPVGFGLLTCDTEQQALDRAGLPGSVEDKGYEAAAAALDSAHLLARLRSASPSAVSPA